MRMASFWKSFVTHYGPKKWAIDMSLIASERLLSSPKELKRLLALSSEDEAFIAHSRSAVEALLSRKDSRLLLIVGPCSLHDEEATLEYARRLLSLSERVKDRFFIVMRAYVEKARSAFAWKGMVNDPHLDGSFDMETGLHKARGLLLEILQMGLPISMEIVDPKGALYFSDLLTLVTIGARTSASQIHREMASSLPCPVGFKNTVSGSIAVAVQGIVTAMRPHTYLGMNEEGMVCQRQSMGNPYCYLVLRGSESGINYDEASITRARALLYKHSIFWPLLIDCAHDNCQKDPKKQKEAFEEVMGAIERGNRNIFGLMLESYLYEGALAFSSNPSYGLSVTDPCLGWEETERLILDTGAEN